MSVKYIKIGEVRSRTSDDYLPEERDPTLNTTPRIAFLLGTSGLFGAENMLISLASYLAGRNHVVTIGLWTSDEVFDQFQSRLDNSAIAVVSLRGKSANPFMALRNLNDFVREGRFNIVHAHGYKAGVLSRIVSKLASEFPPIVYTMHGYGSPGMRYRTWWYEQLDKRTLRWNQKLVLVSTSLQTIANRFFRRECDSLVIENGVDMSSIEVLDAYRVTRGQAAKRFAILGVGRLEEVKGFDLLIRAVGELVREGKQVCLTIVGHGSLDAELKKLALALGISDAVEFRGYVSSPSMFYETVDCLVVSSRSEALPLSVIEACAAGLPVIATNVGSIKEILEVASCGKLVVPESVPALKSAIAELMENVNEEKANAICGSERVRAYFDVSRMSEKYRRLYGEILRLQSEI